MRLLPGQPQEVSGESITSYSLIKHAINNPDVLSTVWQLFGDQESPLSGILGMKGLSSKGLFDGMSTDKYRVVKSNHVQYPIKSADTRKVNFVANSSGNTFVSDAWATKPGYKQTPFYIYLDSNWARPNEVLELNDNTTKLFIYDDQEPVEVEGGYRYEVKLVTNDPADYVDTSLMTPGSEAGCVMALYEQDFSETGSEKRTFDGWGDAYMTLQRVKMSVSGTAAAMGTDKAWYQFHNSKGKQVNTYVDYQDMQMLKRIAAYHEYSLIFGQGTVAEDGQTILKNKKGRDIMAGDGVLNQGDGSYEYPLNDEWTIKNLEAILQDIDAKAGKDGKTEAVMLGGFQNIASFNRMMVANGFVTQNNNVEGSGADKGVINDYSFYEFGGIRLIPKRYRWFDDVGRPSKWLSDGTRKGSWDGIIVPLGLTSGGEKGVELVQLRPMKKGSVSGINKGGEMATSVDGESRHVLVQSGVISRNKILRVFRNSNS